MFFPNRKQNSPPIKKEENPRSVTLGRRSLIPRMRWLFRLMCREKCETLSAPQKQKGIRGIREDSGRESISAQKKRADSPNLRKERGGTVKDSKKDLEGWVERNPIQRGGTISRGA